MEKLENVNKQNYFTEEWKEKYPEASEDFCKWIDEYKNLVEWSNLFNEGILKNAPKFHNLPFEFQIGILSRYIWERCGTGCWIGCNPFVLPFLTSDLNWYFEHIEKILAAQILDAPNSNPVRHET